MIFKHFSNGDTFPLLGLGTWQCKPNEVYEAVLTAIRIGYRHIDCAAIYGNEKEIGSALQYAFSIGLVEREELFITSKLWNNCHAPELVEPALQKTLSDLQLDYLDLYLMHWPIAFKKDCVVIKSADDLVPLTELPLATTWLAMNKLKEYGLVKHIGVSNFSEVKIQALIDKTNINPEVNQIEIHPYFSQEELVSFCHSKNILLTAYSPLGSRHLISNENSITLEPAIIEIAQKHQCSEPQVMLAWGMHRGISVIPKSIHAERLQSNFEAIDLKLDEEDVIRINQINRNMRLSKAKFAIINNSYYTYSNIWDEARTLTYLP